MIEGVSPGMPGLGPEQSTTSRKFLTNTIHIVRRGGIIDKDSDDVNNVGKEHKLRAGLVLVQILTGANAGHYCEITHAEAPTIGNIEAAGILMEDISMRNQEGDREDKPCSLLIHGFVRESECDFGTADVGLIGEMKDILPLIQWEIDVPQP